MESEVTALVVFALPWAAPDILNEVAEICLSVVWFACGTVAVV